MEKNFQILKKNGRKKQAISIGEKPFNLNNKIKKRRNDLKKMMKKSC